MRHFILALLVGLPCAKAQTQPQIALRIKQGQTIDAIFGVNRSTAFSASHIQPVLTGIPAGQRPDVRFWARYTPNNNVVGQYGLNGFPPGNFLPPRVAPPAPSSDHLPLGSGTQFEIDVGFLRGNNQTTAIPGEVHGTYTVEAELTMNGRRYPSNVLTGTVKTAGASPPPPVQQQGASGTQLHRPTTVLRMRFNPKTGKMEVIKNGVISRRGFMNFQGKKLNHRQALRNYRFR